MSSQGSFDNLMGRLHDGDAAAAERVFQRFAARLIALARARLPGKLRAKVGPEDVIQSVFRSFFARHAQGQFDLDGWDSVWAVLTVITVRKCGHQAEFFGAACRNVQREESLPLLPAGDDSPPVFAREPTPSEVVVFTDLLEHLLGGLEGRDREVLAFLLDGHTIAGISARIGRAERTVRRAVGRVRQRLRRMEEEAQAGCPAGSQPGRVPREIRP